MVYYTVYIVTNKVNGKVYIGTHKTKNLDDGYMGSGKYLKRAIEKQGVDSFEKEILFCFDNAEEMFAKEAELVNEEFLCEANTYNLKRGGEGGFDFINKNPTFDRAERARLAGSMGTGFLGKTHSEKHRKTLSKIHKGNSYFGGKRHSLRTKEIMSKKAKERLSDPKNNSQFGTMWITNEKKTPKFSKVTQYRSVGEGDEA